MQWLMAVAADRTDPLREWFLRGPWIEAETDVDLAVYEVESGGDRWLTMTQTLPPHDRQLEWRARELARHCEATTALHWGSGDEDWLVAGHESSAALTAKLSQLLTADRDQLPTLQLRLDPSAQHVLFRQFLLDVPELLHRHLPIRGGRGELVCTQHRIVQPTEWTPTALEHDGLFATTLQLQVYDKPHEELVGIREQELVFCKFPWLTPEAGFVRRGAEYRQPVNEFAADFLAAIERELTESIPGRLRAISDWNRTKPHDVLR